MRVVGAKKSADDLLTEAKLKLRHAAFALSAASASQLPDDRDIAEAYLLEMARLYAQLEQAAKRTP